MFQLEHAFFSLKLGVYEEKMIRVLDILLYLSKGFSYKNGTSQKINKGF